jgi:hypothetical protein
MTFSYLKISSSNITGSFFLIVTDDKYDCVIIDDDDDDDDCLSFSKLTREYLVSLSEIRV